MTWPFPSLYRYTPGRSGTLSSFSSSVTARDSLSPEREHQQAHRDHERQQHHPTERPFHSPEHGRLWPPRPGRIQESQNLAEDEERRRRQREGDEHPLEHHAV